MMDEKTFDEIYGEGMLARVRDIINDLGPVTRRDEWWTTDGPYEIIAGHLKRLKESAQSQATTEEPMQIAMKRRQQYNAEEWHWKFAWWPTRTSETHITWLDWYQRRMHVVAEGNWAGGFKFRWHYANTGGLWEGPIRGD